MEFNLNLGAWNSVFAVPTDVVDKYIKLATGNNIKILLYFLRNAGNVNDCGVIGEKLRIDSDEVCDALKFWEQAGLICINDGEITPVQKDNSASISIRNVENEKTTPANVIKINPVREPQFQPKEIAASVRGNKDVEFLFKRCEELYGRPLKHIEQNTLMIITEDICLPPEIALMMIQHCSSIGKTSPAYLKSTALDWAERGISTINQAEQLIMTRGNSLTLEKQLHSMFEMNTAFSKAQKAAIEKWANEYGYGADMVDAAYQRTLDKTGKLSFPYMSKILDSWHSKGYTSLSQIENDDEKRKTMNDDSPSFDIEDIDRLALEKYRRG